MDRRGRRTLRVAAAALSAAGLLVGCHHKHAITLQPAIVKAPDAPPPSPDAPAMKAPPPTTIATAPPVKVTAAKPKPARKHARPKPPAAAYTVAAAPPVPATPLGELSPGDADHSKLRQDASSLIATIEDRLKGVQQPATGEQEPVRNIRLFLKQAKSALDLGDALGAKTLATKAMLLLDDLPK